MNPFKLYIIDFSESIYLTLACKVVVHLL